MKMLQTKLVGLCLVTMLLYDCGNGKPTTDVFRDAVAVWHMASLNDTTAENSVLVPFAQITLGVKLEGEALKASLQRGGDGLVAKLDGGWLNAGQGIHDELKLSGNAATFMIRVCDPNGNWKGALMGKHGDRSGIAYSIFTDSVAGIGKVLGTAIGSDEIAGMHRMRTPVQDGNSSAWHDILVRFDGHVSQLFVDGNLCDDEVSVGTLRSNNNNPFLIGAAYADSVPLKDNSDMTINQVKDLFNGLIDHAALWNRALTDAEIAVLSGVKNLGDSRPDYYSEKYRPLFHFTPRKSWMNDPNGLVFYGGVYHMCYQHMPPGRPGAYKDWGQAISTDLVHWEVLTSALTPHKTWGGCWSGSAVVDHKNTTGFQKGENPPIIAILTNGGVPGVGPLCTQCIAYSNDGGMTYTYYEKNPVLGHIVAENRDPKVVWHAPTGKWIMALYLNGNDYGLFSSSDMKSWEHICDLNLPGVRECPDLFEIPVDGNKSIKKWVFWGANGNYLIGSFDGRKFIAESDLLKADHGSNFYAAQTWSDIPESDGRCIQIAWMADGVFGEKVVKNLNLPWDQQMNFPTEVTLRTTPEGIRMYREPVKEIELLHEKGSRWQNIKLKPGDNLFSGLSGELFDIRVEAELNKASSLDIMIRGEKIRYNAIEKTISCLGKSAPLQVENGRIKLQVIVDRTSLEVFCNDGRIVMTSCFLPPDDNRELMIFANGEPVNIVSAEVYPLQSIW